MNKREKTDPAGMAGLAGGCLALTLGTAITRDTDAAGYGWFIDPTSLTKKEFLPNSSPLAPRFMSDGLFSLSLSD